MQARPSHFANAPTRSIFEQIKLGISVEEHLTGDVWESISPAAKQGSGHKSRPASHVAPGFSGPRSARPDGSTQATRGRAADRRPRASHNCGGRAQLQLDAGGIRRTPQRYGPLPTANVRLPPTRSCLQGIEAASSSTATAKSDDIEEAVFSDDEEQSGRHPPPHPTGGPEVGAKRQRVVGSLYGLNIAPRPAPASRSTPMHGHAGNAPSRQGPPEPPKQKGPLVANFKMPRPVAKPKAAKSSASGPRVAQLDFRQNSLPGAGPR